MRFQHRKFLTDHSRNISWQKKNALAKKELLLLFRKTLPPNHTPRAGTMRPIHVCAPMPVQFHNNITVVHDLGKSQKTFDSTMLLK
jgi:hypothetical protein